MITSNLINLVAVFVIGLGLFAMISSVAPAVLSDLMPANLRGVGTGAWYNVAIALFGGTAPLLVTALSAAGHQSGFFICIAVMCLVGFVVLVSVPDERRLAPTADGPARIATTPTA